MKSATSSPAGRKKDSGPKVVACGDDQILIDFQGQPNPNEATRVLWARLMQHPPFYCREPVAGVATLAVVLNPASRNDEVRQQACDELTALASDAVGIPAGEGAHRVIPVCYASEMAPDLDRVAQLTGLATTEVVRLHQEGRYLAELIGFMPGFAYMSGVDPRLCVPRLPQPRHVVPVGALAITGNQSAIYPTATPGGWNLIGRCPIRLFNPVLNPPCLIQLGDQVQFEAISVAQFDRLWAKR
ncbi:MAG: carboxyltransferase domain-containing protein [Betaproteobacteria bacterium]|nr:carboxyltransferase domain-containing protein [Betaproteobacteria bacterium]